MKNKKLRRLLTTVLAMVMVVSQVLTARAEAELSEFSAVAAYDMFVDILPTDWYYESTQYVYDRGIMTGVNQDTFDPCGIMSRAQMAQMFYRISTEKNIPEYSGIFPDVENGLWYTDAVMWAANSGLMTGYSTGCFGPADAMNREQLAVVLYRYAMVIGCSTGNATDTNLDIYADSWQISDFARESVAWCVGMGIMGQGVALLNPGGQVTRAEGAAMLMRFLESFGYTQNTTTITNYHSHKGGMNIVHWMQTDSKWADISYGNGRIASNACGPSSLAMVASYLRGINVTPLDIVNEIGNSYWAGGTTNSLFSEYPSGHGFRLVYTGYDINTVISELQAGHPVIALIQRDYAPLTVPTAGHFIVLRGLTADGRIYVNDSFSEANSSTAFDAAFIAAGAKKFWSYSK